ncbi:MAG: hypothetical protein ACREWG_16725 [Gammaproteobacteria bacterium]
MEPGRIGFKCFLEQGHDIALGEFIPVFHRWIQTRALDEMLIDVADYGHVVDGPGVLLVAHAGNYSLDEAGGERGLVYYSKRGLEGPLATRLETVLTRLLQAALALEEAAELAGRLRFTATRLHCFVNDRLLAPNTAATHERLEPVLNGLCSRLYGPEAFTLARDPDPKQRYAVTVTGPQNASLAGLGERLEAYRAGERP